MPAASERDAIGGSIGIAAGELQGRVVRGVASSALAAMIGLPLAIAVSVVLARTLGAEGYARFALLSFLVPLLAQATTDAGFDQAAARAVARAWSAGEATPAREVLGKASGWNLLRVPVTWLIVVAIARPGPGLAVALLGAVLVVHVGYGFALALTAQNRIAAVARAGLFGGMVAAAASIATAVAGGSAEAVWTAGFAGAAANVPLLALAAEPTLRRAALRPRLPRGLPPGFWRYGLTTVALSVGGLLVFSRSELVVLELLERHPEVAVFALAAGLAQRLTAPMDTLLGPLVPALASLDAVRPDRLLEGVERAFRLSTAGAAFAVVAVVPVALAVPLVYGPEFHALSAVFAVLALAALARSAIQPYTAVAYALARPGAVLKAYAVALAVDAGLAFALIPVAGVWGAVAANVAAALVATALVARAAAGLASVRRAAVPAFRLALVAIAAAGAGLVAGWAAGTIAAELGPPAGLVGGVAAAFAVARARGGVVAWADADALLAVLAGRLPRVQRLARLLVSPAQ